MDCKFGASVQNCVCLLVHRECVGADEYVSACVICTTCLLFTSVIIIVIYY